MKKIVKYIMEIIFIFIIPLLLIIFNINIKKVYDENNNEIEKHLEFNESLLQEYGENFQYKNILDYNQIKYSSGIVTLNNGYNDIKFVSSVSSVITIIPNIVLDVNHKYYIEFKKIDGFMNDVRLYSSDTSSYLNSFTSDYFNIFINSLTSVDLNMIITNGDSYDARFYFTVIDLTQMFGLGYEPNNFTNYNQFINYNENSIDSELVYYYSNSIVSENYELNYSWYSKIFNNLFNALNINNNIPLTIIIIYTLLWLIMWFIWHLLYLPLDFICSKLLFDRVDK